MFAITEAIHNLVVCLHSIRRLNRLFCPQTLFDTQHKHLLTHDIHCEHIPLKFWLRTLNNNSGHVKINLPQAVHEWYFGIISSVDGHNPEQKSQVDLFLSLRKIWLSISPKTFVEVWTEASSDVSQRKLDWQQHYDYDCIVDVWHKTRRMNRRTETKRAREGNGDVLVKVNSLYGQIQK
jgi:hypothetical protein